MPCSPMVRANSSSGMPYAASVSTVRRCSAVPSNFGLAMDVRLIRKSWFPFPCGFNPLEGSAVPCQCGLLARYLLPAAHNHIDVAGIDVDAVADPLQQFTRDQGCPRAKERIVNQVSALGVVQNGPTHQLDRLLCSVPRRNLFAVTPEGVQIGNLPQGRLRAVSAPVGLASFSDCKKTGFVLPVVRTSTHHKVLLGPDNLGPDREARRMECVTC